MDRDGWWKNVRGDGKFLFPVKGLSKMFRAKYVAELRKANIAPHAFGRTCKDYTSAPLSYLQNRNAHSVYNFWRTRSARVHSLRANFSILLKTWVGEGMPLCEEFD